MNVEIGAEAALFPEEEYISGIFLAVHVGVTTTEKLDQGSLSPLQKHPRQKYPGRGLNIRPPAQ